jgi:DEAD/DEAH box helicase domain-containing protein
LSHSISLSTLIGNLNTRAARAAVGDLRLNHDALRNHLADRFSNGPGEFAAFLADPVIEAAFGYEQTVETVGDLAGSLLEPRLVQQLDAPPKLFRDHRFASTLHPYVHQLKSWQAAQDPKCRGYVVSSGTGSGKTECFLIPILNDLVREANGTSLTGVRALFLYPLNALINSQRDRLRAWTRGFRGLLRYCLYNGETPQDVPRADQVAAPEEVLSRKVLRSNPPPLLVTNATMLEYMLVRRDDAPILGMSSGLLRWIVIDEAHTYVGSQAAELSMLLRRVVDAFGANRQLLKIVATSATLGGGEGDRVGALRKYFADLAGVAPGAVEVIIGRRKVPDLPEWRSASNPSSDVGGLAAIDEAARFSVLCGWPAFRKLRADLGEAPMLLSTVRERLRRPDGSVMASEEALRFLDCAATARKDDHLLLPLRAHVFHRTQQGVWSCISSECPGKAKDLAEDKWPFGRLFFRRRTACTTDCGALVLEVLRCVDCGEIYLAAEEETRAGVRYISPTAPIKYPTDDDEPFELIDLDDDESAEKLDERPDRITRYIATRTHEGTASVAIDSMSGEIAADCNAALDFLVSDDQGRLRCVGCGINTSSDRRAVAPLRVGAPFVLNVAVPTLLESTSPLELSKPFEGRRLITFSDSRQGTAKFAVRMQLDADRNRVRSIIYHQLAAVRVDRSASGEVDEIRRQIADLEKLDNLSPVLDQLLQALRRKLELISGAFEATLPWDHMTVALERDTPIREWMPEMWEQFSFGDLTRSDFGHFCLLRELLRRPRTQNSLETLGLAAVRYPTVDSIDDSRSPRVFRERGLSPQDWRDFLYLILDQFVRANSAVKVPPKFLDWIGAPMRTNYLVEPGADKTRQNQILWPAPTRRSKFNVIAATALRLSLDDADDRRLIQDLYDDAWNTIRPLLAGYADGFLLDMRTSAAVGEVSEAQRCPITARLFRRPFRNLSPNIGRTAATAPSTSSVTMPLLKDPFWRASSANAWLDTDEMVQRLRGSGIWTYSHDRIAAMSPYYRTVEHSAQQSSSDLRRYEEDFRTGDINVLSCSTTMELGVDIGGISAVAMNNAPPSPANFLQRAGRAGRRKEAVTASLTICKADPHGEAVFANPLWPFITPTYIPKVSLDSERVVQRHVNSFLLAEYMKKGVPSDPPTLSAGWFFREGLANSPADGFMAWCHQIEDRSQLASRLKHLVMGSVLERFTQSKIARRTAEELVPVAVKWKAELAALDAVIEEFGSTTDAGTPAQLAAKRQRERLVDEYLLRELTSRGFLPGYGFPTHVVSFVNTTLKQLRWEHTADREDSIHRYHGYPSREIALAIRDYAPGNDVVLNGRVFKSEGVTLNWHIPPGDSSVRETQVFEFAWRCGVCAGTGSERVLPQKCPACSSDRALDVHKYLQPAGFAVGIGYKPHNRLSGRFFVPTEDPWITAGTATWSKVASKIASGRYRVSAHGHVFHYSRGLFNHGFAICLRCGRADSDSADERLPSGLRDHTRLRGGKERSGDSRCAGNDEHWAIQRRIWLGAKYETDVFEIQLQSNQHGFDEEAALSMAVALRRALAELLGVEEREIGCGAQLQRTETQAVTWSAVLFDRATGGAGYSTLAGDDVPALLARAAKHLECRCDRACHRCLITYETQHRADKLNRIAALRFVS